MMSPQRRDWLEGYALGVGVAFLVSAHWWSAAIFLTAWAAICLIKRTKYGRTE